MEKHKVITRKRSFQWRSSTHQKTRGLRGLRVLQNENKAEERLPPSSLNPSPGHVTETLLSSVSASGKLEPHTCLTLTGGANDP